MLDLMKDGAVIRSVRPGRGFSLPNGDRVSPAVPGWSNEDGYSLVEAPVPPPPPPPTLDQLKAAKLEELAERRYRAEESGTTFNGNPLSTDRTTQNKLTAAYVKASASNGYSIPKWKFGPGVFAPLNAGTILAVAAAVEAHVQACFANEAALSDVVLQAEDEAALVAIDLEAGWP